MLAEPEPHMAPLIAYRERLELDGIGEVPSFDPLDGGVNARVLFLLEKPGPKTSRNGSGSGFISRDNNDQSAAHSFVFHHDSGLDRRETLLWNLIPWWDGAIKFTREQERLGLERAKELLDLMPRLDTVVLVGSTAHKAESKLCLPGLRILKSAHPSAQVKAFNPTLFYAIPKVWKQAAIRVGSEKD
jgi:hypothetical protein